MNKTDWIPALLELKVYREGLTFNWLVAKSRTTSNVKTTFMHVWAHHASVLFHHLGDEIQTPDLYTEPLLTHYAWYFSSVPPSSAPSLAIAPAHFFYFLFQWILRPLGAEMFSIILSLDSSMLFGIWEMFSKPNGERCLQVESLCDGVSNSQFPHVSRQTRKPLSEVGRVRFLCLARCWPLLHLNFLILSCRCLFSIT